ncbi:MAG: P22 coat protein - protein 5 domain protein [Ruminococcaceae bacterium]|nr:P22 coat protein - protein 5 domain protein [Oscillospiraceae bacterium]
MAISNFIPTIWSENLYTALDRKYIAVSNCTREYEGEIKNKGSVVKICGVGKVNVTDYTKDSDMDTPQSLSDTVKELYIDQAKCFNFQIDDVDRAQCTPRLMEAAMKVAANSLADAADKYVYSLAKSEELRNFDASQATPETIINTIIEARQRLYEKNVSDSEGVVLEVTPMVASLILKAKISLSTDNIDSLEHGCIGSIAGCKVFVSPNVATERDGTIVTHKCMMRTRRAIAFAEQLSEIDAYRPEKRFADAVKGLHIYGAEIIYPEEVVVINVTT